MPKHIDALSSNKKPATIPVPPGSETTPTPVVSTPMTNPGEPTPTPQNEQPTTADTFETLFPEPSVAISGPPRWFWWTLLAIGVISLAMVGYSLFKNKNSNWLGAASSPSPTTTATSTPTPTETPKTTPTATPSPSASATATPTPSSSATVNSKITIRVLNGTTVAGAAAKARDYLTTAGLSVRTIGNATHQDYSSTVIYYQTGYISEAQSVQAALKTHYSITLQESSLADPDMVLVVIGTN